MFGFIVLTISRVALIAIVWINWYLAKPTPFFVAFILTLLFLQQVVEHVQRRDLQRSGAPD